jgi:hypothetical protein
VERDEKDVRYIAKCQRCCKMWLMGRSVWFEILPHI